MLFFRRYFAWYSDTGHTELIFRQMTNELRAWHRAKKRPILVTEYGADTVAGLHREPSYIFTEDYQTEFIREYFKVRKGG